MATLRVQSFRFVTVGLVSNLVLYLFYIVLTWIGLSPSLAVGVVFMAGALQTFIFNKKWTFSQQQNGSTQVAKYLTIYIGGYLANIFIIHIFVNRMAYSHQWVQAGAVALIGVFLFVGQRYWVFAPRDLQK